MPREPGLALDAVADKIVDMMDELTEEGQGFGGYRVRPPSLRRIDHYHTIQARPVHAGRVFLLHWPLRATAPASMPGLQEISRIRSRRLPDQTNAHKCQLPCRPV